MHNEYLSEFHKVKPKGWDSWSSRHGLVLQYSWAIPGAAALNRLVSGGPMLEVASGKGYWAKLLSDMGLDIVATDIEPWSDPFLPIQKMDAVEAVKVHGHDRNLLLVWPPFGDPMASHALATFMEVNPTGTVYYVGEGDGGCTGDDNFHSILATSFEETELVDVPQWVGIHDHLMVWTRKLIQ